MKLPLSFSCRRACAIFEPRALLTAGLFAAMAVSTAASSAQDAAPPAAQSTAESGSGGVHGQVTDPTGAVIPNATVVALTTAGQVTGKATSKDAGNL